MHKSSAPAPLSFAIACRSSSYVSALSHISLSDPTDVCDGTVYSNNVYPSSKPIRPSKPMCLSNVRPSKPIISSNFYLSKPVRPKNISSSRCIRSSDVCQSRSNITASKPVRPIYVCLSKPVRPSNITPSKPVCPSNACLMLVKFIVYCFVVFGIVLLICIFVNLLHIFRNIVNLFYILSLRSVSVNVDKDITHTVHLESNITSLELLIICPGTF